jgi:hypothetical protein
MLRYAIKLYKFGEIEKEIKGGIRKIRFIVFLRETFT